MTLSDKRQIFTRNLANLITWGFAQGYGLALDQVKRTQAEANANAESGVGIVHSLHIIGLAADILLYHPDYKTGSTDYKPLGDYWKTLDVLNRWGGDFSKPDGNHFSMEHNGVK